MSPGAVPVRESVGAALRYVRENMRFIAIVAGIFAAASTLVSAFALAMPQAGILTMVANGIIQAFCYGALGAGALYGVDSVRARWSQDGWRVWSSMVVVGFFMAIVVLVFSIPVTITLIAGPMARYSADLQAAGSDQAAVMQIMTRFFEENPGSALCSSLCFGAVCLSLTPRASPAPPATVDADPSLTFNTCNRTVGLLRCIASARMVSIVPTSIRMFAYTLLHRRIFDYILLV